MAFSEAQAKEALLAKKAEIEADLAEPEPIADDIEGKMGQLTRQDALQRRAFAEEATRRRKIELTKIEAALDRLEIGEYGECVRCGEEISEKRLALDPATPLCIDCAKGS